MTTTTTQTRLPGRYVIHHHVASPLTCRHKYRCPCHGDPPAPEKVRKKAEEAAALEANRQLVELSSIIALALKPFPEAQTAINNAIRDHERRKPS
jgi:hypothetical protein